MAKTCRIVHNVGPHYTLHFTGGVALTPTFRNTNTHILDQFVTFIKCQEISRTEYIKQRVYLHKNDEKAEINKT